MANLVDRIILCDIATTAASGIDLTDTEIAAKAEAGALGLLVKGSTQVQGITTDSSGNIYLADSATHAVYKVAEGGVISTVAGDAGTSGRNGTLTNLNNQAARFNAPAYCACDKSGAVYISDTGNNQIRVIRGGKVSHFAGNGDGVAGYVDGTALACRFDSPGGLCVDNDGAVYVADTGNNCIRKITGNTVITIAGRNATADNENIRASSSTACFNAPRDIAMMPNGNLVVLDSGNYKIKVIDKKGWLYLLSGAGTAGQTLGTAGNQQYTCTYRDLYCCDIDKTGNIYVAECNGGSYKDRLIKVAPDGTPSNINIVETTATANVGSLIGVAVNKSQKLLVIFSDVRDPR